MASPRISFPTDRQDRIDRALLAGGAAPSRLDWLHLQACGLLRRSFADSDYGVPQLVAELATSRPTLYRAFAHRNDTVAACMRRVRLERVCELLAQPPFTIPIESLAYRCGFQDTRTFSRCFRKEFGLTAGAFRIRALQQALCEVRVREHEQLTPA